MKSYMDHVNYSTLVDPRREMLRADFWDIECTRIPEAVYFPGIQVIRERVNSITGFRTPDVEVLTASIRGFEIMQPGRAPFTRTDLTFTCIDYIDRTMTTWVMASKVAAGNPLNMDIVPIPSLTSDWIFTKVDSLKRPIQRWVYKNAFITTNEDNYDMTPDPALESAEMTFTMTGYLLPVQILTIPTS